MGYFQRHTARAPLWWQRNDAESAWSRTTSPARARPTPSDMVKKNSKFLSSKVVQYPLVGRLHNACGQSRCHEKRTSLPLLKFYSAFSLFFITKKQNVFSSIISRPDIFNFYLVQTSTRGLEIRCIEKSESEFVTAKCAQYDCSFYIRTFYTPKQG